MAIAAPFPSVRAHDRRPMRHAEPVRLTRRGRVVLGVFTALVAVIALSATGPQADAADAASLEPVTASVVVQPGDTLWTIAKSLDPTADPRPMVERIRELNALPGAVVVTGQALIVPRVGD